jgi:hypothetical protein
MAAGLCAGPEISDLQPGTDASANAIGDNLRGDWNGPVSES